MKQPTSPRPSPADREVDDVNRAIRERLGKPDFFHRFARSTANLLGTPLAFVLALAFVLGWALSGPIFHFGEGWQLTINTSTTIGTFLMLFALQHSQNHDTIALHMKLDEIIRAMDQADDRLAGIENHDVDPGLSPP